MEMKRYENAAGVVDVSMLEQDKLTFALVIQVLEAPCRKILTDHARVLLCYTTPPYPVWAWLPDDAGEDEMEQVRQCILAEFPPEEGFCFNTKYALAEYLIRREAEEGREWVIHTNMLAYDCPGLTPPARPVDGALVLPKPEEQEQVAALLKGSYWDTERIVRTEEELLENARQCIEDKSLYLWKNREGIPVALCGWKGSGRVGPVYTVPAFRRQGYAARMVYEVTEKLMEMGLTPHLYTDADYTASNRCYQMLGYVQRGSLCKVGLREEKPAEA
ncbi:MAG: GNAT family N-acetyltransferase [Oscillospiraceae bacterium]|jgi:GNAT superfamily N-acetyltransferase|nr:GNAT family N-acetyltransferase [Oscillospiraceae bacterium]